MGWIESAVRQLIQRVEYLYRWMDRLVAQQNNARQQLLAAVQAAGAGGSGSLAIYVVMAPASGTYQGTWSGSAPTGGSSFTGTVYQVSGTGTITSMGTQTCVNWMPAALANSKACYCIPDGAGNYAIISQSCT